MRTGVTRRFYSLALALPILIVLAACSQEAPPPEPPRPVLTQVLGEKATGEAVSYAGEVLSRYETPLAFRISGKIASRLVDVGARVKAGQLLATLDPADTALSAAAAEAQRALADADARRYRELRGKNFVSQAALDAKETTFTAARAQADLARNQRAYTQLKADHDGVIGLVSAEVGQVVSAGQTVFRVSRPDSLEVAISIPEARMPELRPLQDAQVSLWADDRASYKAVLRELSSVADATTRTYAARVAILHPDAKVLLGMTANVRFSDASGNARLSVPLTAIFQQGGKPALWIVSAEQTVALRPVTVLSYGETSAVLGGGAKAGERFVVSGVHKLTVGEKITLAGATATPAP
jgi:RND family efflux transporter MFP subunit